MFWNIVSLIFSVFFLKFNLKKGLKHVTKRLTLWTKVNNRFKLPKNILWIVGRQIPGI